jgi:hypothetical protein
MSIDIEILPMVNTPIRWIDLKSQIAKFFHQRELNSLVNTLIWKDPKLLNLRSNIEIADEEAIRPTTNYAFSLACNNTLILCCDNNAETYTNEQEFLEDFGRNLKKDHQSQIADRWEKVGYTYAIDSSGGRAKGELDLLIIIACALAQLSKGFAVIKDNDVFSFPVGVYSAMEFLKCEVS